MGIQSVSSVENSSTPPVETERLEEPKQEEEPKLDKSSLVTAKQEKAIEDVLAKLKVKKLIGTSQTSVEENFSIDVKQRRSVFGHTVQVVKAPTTEAIETKVESEAVSRKSSVASLVEVEKEDTTDVVVSSSPGVIILERNTTTSVQNQNATTQRAKPAFVNIKPKAVSSARMSMTSLNKDEDYIGQFSYQDSPISATSPIKADLDNMLIAHAQSIKTNSSSERSSERSNYDTLPRKPIEDIEIERKMSISSITSSLKSQTISTQEQESAEVEIPEELDDKATDDGMTTEDNSEKHDEDAKESSAEDITADKTTQEITEENSEKIEDAKDSEDGWGVAEVVIATPAEVIAEEPVIIETPVPAPRRSKPEFKNVSRNSQGSSLFTMREYSSRDARNSQLW